MKLQLQFAAGIYPVQIKPEENVIILKVNILMQKSLTDI